MAFSIDSDHLPAFRSYQKAKEWYNGITPIRGSNDIRPLGKRTAQHMRIVQTTHDGINAIACVLYRTECVVFLEDGRTWLNNGGWVTQSTIKFIDRVFALGRVKSAGYTMLYVHAGKEYELQANGLYVDAAGIPIDPPSCTIHTVDRKAMAAVRKRYAPFMAYVRAIGKLKDHKYDRDEVKPARGRARDMIIELAQSDNPEDWYDTLSPLWYAANPRISGWQAWQQSNSNTHTIPEAAVTRTFNRMMLEEHASEVLVREVLPVGEWRKDKYRHLA